MAKKSVRARVPSSAKLSGTLRKLADALDASSATSLQEDPAHELALQELAEAADKAYRLLAVASKPTRTRKSIVEANLTPPRFQAPEEEDFGMPIDREANQWLQTWGKMSFQAFLDQWGAVPVSMLRRAASAVGLPYPRRWSRTSQEDLHRRALRFVRNTTV